MLAHMHTISVSIKTNIVYIGFRIAGLLSQSFKGKLMYARGETSTLALLKLHTKLLSSSIHCLASQMIS